MTASAQNFLATFGRLAQNTKEKGYLFERLVKAWLQNAPEHRHEFAQVELWGDWAARRNMDRRDVGIDLVARTYDGEHCAIQCKFFDPRRKLEKANIDSFFTAAGQTWGGVEFTSLKIVSTTPHWSEHAEKALARRPKVKCTRVDFADELSAANIDWNAVNAVLPYDIPAAIEPEQTAIPVHDRLDVAQINLEKLLAKIVPVATGPAGRKTPHSYQEDAINDVVAGFKNADRGKLVMACGTGKTFVSLKVAEEMVAEGGSVLFLVPSIALLSQTLREWSAQSARPLRNFAVCSDAKAGRDEEDIQVYDLAIPATTNAKKLADKLAQKDPERTSIVFSTYHSLDVVAEAQGAGAPKFDLIICDEAHRTTGVEGGGKKQSYFTKVHDPEYLRGRKRLYMTATPRIYSDSAKKRAKEQDVDVFSMDSPKEYGGEFHRLDFSTAVSMGCLSDYKVLILAVDEEHVSKAMQAEFASNGELNLSDAVKIVGCWKGLAKEIKNAEEGGITGAAPMRRAVAFAQTIKASQHITDHFNKVVREYTDRDPDALDCAVRHVDGAQNALVRNQALQWLRQGPPQDNGCHVLSNVRCLSEGVDVPALDAVMFLNPRESQVEIVQSVGRVMRKAKGKNYGYIILPIGISANLSSEEALDDNKKYRVVWQVLQALRAHDDRFNAEINKIELNKKKDGQIKVIGVGPNGKDAGEGGLTGLSEIIPEDFAELRGAIYAKMVLKCGERRYWETWARDVADIAARSITRIQTMVEQGEEHRKSFGEFLAGLRQNLNPAVSEMDAIEMLAQHMITRPVFNALFADSDFVSENPVSKAMSDMLELLDEQNFARETGGLERFYQSVARRAEGIDNNAGRQKIIVELYDKFFRTAFPKMAESLGIVYTPVEVVDFIINSAEHLMQKEFGRGLTAKDVHILDPFTGTGTFITRLLQSGAIADADLPRKYAGEIHANEIVLLAYYIAAVNIEQAYQARRPAGGAYAPFEGIALTDTFQINERSDGKHDIINKIFPINSERVERQKNAPIRVVFGNPPYSVGQKSENDANKNLKYKKLDGRIGATYVAHSNAKLKRNLYDSYIRAIRWSSDRIGEEGIVAFITNSSYIDSNAMDGLRKCLCDDFSAVHCVNLRGNIRANMQNKSAGEGGNIFGKTMVGASLLFLVKKPKQAAAKSVHYYDIGDNLSRQEKLDILTRLGNIAKIDWKTIVPNARFDWINQRDPEFQTYLPMGDPVNKQKKGAAESVFLLYGNGLMTSRDAWVYNFSEEKLSEKMQSMIAFYNSEVARYKSASGSTSADAFVDNDPQKISWDRTLKKYLSKKETAAFSVKNIRKCIHRPFVLQWVYFSKTFISERYRQPSFFPDAATKNLTICVSGVGAGKKFSALMVDTVSDFETVTKNQCFPRYRYENASGKNADILGESGGLRRVDNIPAATVRLFQSHYQNTDINGDAIFCYVYGVLHSAQYKSRFAADLRKSLPRIPYAKTFADFRAFSEAGKKLADLHVNYETAESYPLLVREQNATGESDDYFKVRKMVYAGGRNPDKSIIQYNDNITLEDIPPDAHEYIVNGKSALDWILDRYQKKTDQKTTITNDPNDWSDDPRYIIDLICKVVTVSVETVKIVRALPELP